MIRAGILGWPISHSLSPVLHGHWLDRLGIDGRYEALAVEPERFAAVCDRLLTDDGWRGFNVTIPHKEAAFAYCRSHDRAAEALRAVNTVIVRENGLIEGWNTDLYGFITNLQSDPEWSAVGRSRAVLIGAGGAARAVLKALSDWGFEDIVVANRTTARAEALIAEIAAPGSRTVDLAALPDVLADTDLLVNSTSLGMSGQPALVLPLDRLPARAMVTDLVYRPLETPLLAEARARGNPVVDGLGMLLHQGAAGFQAWFGTEAPPPVDDDLRRHVLEAMAG